MDFTLGGWLARIWKDNPKEKKRTLYIGIDPGGQGGIGFIYGDHHTAIDIPTFKTKVKQTGKRKTRTDYDLDRIVDIFYGIQGFHGNIKAAVEIAVPQMKYGKSAYAAYRVGCGYYMWPLFLKSKNYKVYEVHPLTWKTKTKLKGKSKWRAMERARKQFPDAELHLGKHEGRCEALLIAQYIKVVSEEGDDVSKQRVGKGDIRKRRQREV